MGSLIRLNLSCHEDDVVVSTYLENVRYEGFQVNGRQMERVKGRESQSSI